jgi:tetratricopeptide (TPR) repeat protein
VFGKIESALFDLGRYSEVENFYLRILESDSSNFEAIIRLANVLEEKGEEGAALTLIEDAIDPESSDVRGEIMKLKLSLLTSTPVELSHQVDSILEKLSDAEHI